MRAERLPQKHVGIVVRRHALAQPLVQRRRVIDAAVAIARAVNDGGLFADGESRLAFLLRFAPRLSRRRDSKGHGENRQHKKSCSERLHNSPKLFGNEPRWIRSSSVITSTAMYIVLCGRIGELVVPASAGE